MVCEQQDLVLCCGSRAADTSNEHGTVGVEKVRLSSWQQHWRPRWGGRLRWLERPVPAELMDTASAGTLDNHGDNENDKLFKGGQCMAGRRLHKVSSSRKMTAH